MNVLSDILCNTSSLILSSSYSGPLLSHDASVNTKTYPKENLMQTGKNFHLLDSFGGAPVPSGVEVSNPASVHNGIFPHAIGQGNVGVDIIPPNFPVSGNEQANDFNSNVYNDSVPSWLANDILKASESISTDFLPIDDLYPQERNDILGINFPQGINNHEKSFVNSSSGYLADHQSLNNANHGFSTTESLLMPTLDVPQLPVEKNSLPDQRYSHNDVGHSGDATQSIINAILPLGDHCDLSSTNQLLSLPSEINDSHLNTSMNGINIGSSSQTPTMNMINEKLPQIALNHLDLALDDMQMIQSNFTGVQMSDKNTCNSYPDESGMESCNQNLGIMSCNEESLSNINVSSFAQSQGIVDITRPLPHNIVNVAETPCLTEDPINSAIVETRCFKCKYCNYISLEKDSVRDHIQTSHLKSIHQNDNLSPNYDATLGNSPSVDCQTVSDLPSLIGHNEPLMQFQQVSSHTTGNKENKFLCSKCPASFSLLKTFEEHLASAHSTRPANLRLNSPQNKTNSSLIKDNADLHPVPSIIMEPKLSYGQPQIAHTDNISRQSNDILLKDTEGASESEILKKKDSSPKCGLDDKQQSPQRKVSSHKTAWRKKLKRELGSYICEFKGCNVRFRALDNLEYHRKCHITGSGKFACPECGISFDHWGKAAGHLWRDHSTDLELHACGQCSFKTYSLSNLEINHKPTHQDQYSFTCDTCGKGFKNRKQLWTHQRIHSKEPGKSVKNFSCFICSRHFLKMQFLRLHLDQVHNKQKSYVCNQCGYSAGKSSTLAMHMRRHMGEKPFACDQCKYRTADHNSLRRHKMKHSGEKPYRCHFCSYACIQASTYKAHVEKRHADRMHTIMFSCNICSFQTLRRDNYNAHMADHEMERASKQVDHNAVRVQPETTWNSKDSEVYPLVEAVDISLSHGDRSILDGVGKDIQSYLNESRLLDTLNA